DLLVGDLVAHLDVVGELVVGGGDVDLHVLGHSFRFLRSMPLPGGGLRFCFASNARRAWSGIVPPFFCFGFTVPVTGSVPSISWSALLTSLNEIDACCIAFWAYSACCCARTWRFGWFS